jgi:hypothetical protein
MNKDPYNENAARGLSASIDLLDTEACIQCFLERTKGLSRYVLTENNSLYEDLEYQNAPLDKWKHARIAAYSTTGDSKDPWLLNLNEENTDDILRRVLKWTASAHRAEGYPLGERYLCALIGIEGSLEQFVRHMNMNARYLLPGRERNSAFRFFDPRVMHTLMRILTSQQRILLLGGARCWAYVDFQSRFRMRENKRYLAMSKVMLKPEQIEVLKLNSHVYQTLRCLNKYRELWTENTDADIIEYLRETDFELLDEEWNIAHYAALLWRITRGLAKPEWAQIALERWTKDRIHITTTLKELMPKPPMTEQEREDLKHEIKKFNEARKASGQPLIPMPDELMP